MDLSGKYDCGSPCWSRLRINFFFFKQKRAYGMRMSDWSSDVCSSDLRQVVGVGVALAAVADDHDLLGLDQVHVGVAIVIDAHASLLSGLSLSRVFGVAAFTAGRTVAAVGRRFSGPAPAGP